MKSYINCAVLFKSSCIIKKIERNSQSLGELTRKIFVGLQTSADKVFVLEYISEKRNTYNCFSKSLNGQIEIEKELGKLFLFGKDVKRFKRPNPKNVVIFPYQISSNKALLMPKDFIQENYPLGWRYLLRNKAELEAREKFRFKDTWWQYGRTQNLTEFEALKIITPDIANNCQFTIDKINLYHTTTVFALSFNELKKNNELFYLGLLNSRLMWFHIKNVGTILRGGYTRFHKQYIENFRVRQADLQKSGEKLIHDEVVKSVAQIMSLHETLDKTQLQSTIEQLNAKIRFLENNIDVLLFKLYELNKTEISIIMETL